MINWVWSLFRPYPQSDLDIPQVEQEKLYQKISLIKDEVSNLLNESAKKAKKILNVLSKTELLLQEYALTISKEKDLKSLIVKITDCLAVHEYKKIMIVVKEWQEFLIPPLDPSTFDLTNSFMFQEEENSAKLQEALVTMHQDVQEPKPKKEEEVWAVPGYPAAAKSRKEYFQMLTEYNGEQESLPNEWIEEFLSSISKASRHFVDVDGVYAPIQDQVAVDLHRLQNIHIDGKPLKIQKGKNRSAAQIVKEVYLDLLKQFDYDIKLTENLSKLLTQGSLSRVFEMIVRRFGSFHESIIPSSAQRMIIDISTGDPMRIFYGGVFGLQDINKRGFDLTIKQIAAARIINIPKEELRSGKVLKGTLTETFSPWVGTLDEGMEHLNAMRLTSSLS